MWEVIVGNVGTVYSGSEDLARVAYAQYVEYSEAPTGRCSGEAVTLMHDGEPVQEFVVLYYSLRFTKDLRAANASDDATAALVIPARKYNNCGGSPTEMSKLFPASEAPKMRYMQVSYGYITWEEAFAHDHVTQDSKGLNLRVNVW